MGIPPVNNNVKQKPNVLSKNCSGSHGLIFTI